MQREALDEEESRHLGKGVVLTKRSCEKNAREESDKVEEKKESLKLRHHGQD